MNILAIETSCDETAVAVIEVKSEKLKVKSAENIRVLSNVISSQVKLHAKYGGVVPNLASREHVKNIGHVLKTALSEAGVSDIKKDIDLIAVTRGPGLGPSLLVGLTFARTLAWNHKKPLIGVDHMDGHIHSNWLEPKQPLQNIFPALNLLVSGGHTELILMKDHGDYEMLGETLDDAVGEAFDKVARLLGLGYPGGPAIAKLAEQGDPERYPLPSPMARSKNYDFSYSGLKTAVLYLIRDLTKSSPSASSGQYRLSAKRKADIAASFQKAAIEVLIDKTIRAATQHHAKAILLSGGVSANTLLRERLQDAGTELGIPFFCPQMKYTTDNAAMIGAAAYFAYQRSKQKRFDWKSVRMDANLSLAAYA